MRMSMQRRVAVVLIALGLIASLLVAYDRWRYEAQNKSVEVTIDQQDLSDFAHAYGYDLDELLREMRRAGLTSVAAYEELGQRVNDGGRALVQSGAQIINAARDSALADPLLAKMVRSRTIDPASVYVLVYDPATLARYLTAFGTQFEPSTVHVLRRSMPALIAVKTQIDFFNSMGLGIPQDFADRVRHLGLLVDPRVQNNERLGPGQISGIFDQILQGGEVGTVIFFGQRNEVLGYPFQLDATADAIKRTHINFGDVEAYSDDQIQKGTQTLGTDIPSQTVRVQAIAQPLLQKMQLDDVVGTYLLGVRERNIRVIYLRTFPHVIQSVGADGSQTTLSAEQTNLVMLRELRDRLEANGFHEGRAEGFVDFKGGKLPLLWFVVLLGSAAAFVLLLDLFGWARAWLPWTLYALTTVAYWGAVAIHHDEFVRKAGALGAALTFAVLAGMSLARWFAPSQRTRRFRYEGEHRSPNFAHARRGGARARDERGDCMRRRGIRHRAACASDIHARDQPVRRRQDAARRAPARTAAALRVHAHVRRTHQGGGGRDRAGQSVAASPRCSCSRPPRSCSCCGPAISPTSASPASRHNCADCSRNYWARARASKNSR